MAYWGVDSWNMADEPLGSRRRSLFEIVSRWAGESPKFWGRYIGKGDHTRTPPLTRREVQFVFSESGGDCKILVIYNGASPADVRGNAATGAGHAQLAVRWAEAIGVPSGVRIYLNIEPAWRPSAAFFQGWWTGMKTSRYAGMGGVYANPDFVTISAPYAEALEALSPADRFCTTRYHWSTRPGVGTPRPSGLSAMAFRPRRLGNVRASLRRVMDQTPWNDPTVLWQFARNCRCGAGAPIVDLNLADQFGYRDLWSSGMSLASARAARVATRSVGRLMGSPPVR